VSRNPIPPGRWDEVMARDGGSCQVYAFAFPTEQRCWGRVILHHRKPKGMGGTFDPAIHDMDNLVALCDRHHVEVHHRPTESYDCGLLIRR
jgi:hypothetical protein